MLTRFHLAVILYVFWNIISIFWSLDQDRSITRVLTFVQLFGLTLLLWDLLITSTQIWMSLQAYILGAWISVGSMIINYLTLGATTSSGVAVRYTAIGLNANFMGFILVLGVPVAWYLAISPANRIGNIYLKLLNLLYIPSAFFAILLTASRTVFITTIPAFLFILLSINRLNLLQKILIFGAVIGITIVIPSIVPQTSLARLATIQASLAEGDLSNRQHHWYNAGQAFFDNPLLGVGTAAFPTSYGLGHEAHNIALSILSELGIVGFILFITILAITIRLVYQQPTWESGLWFTILLIWLLNNMAADWQYRKVTWLFFSLMISGAYFARPNERSLSRLRHIGQRGWGRLTYRRPQPMNPVLSHRMDISENNRPSLMPQSPLKSRKTRFA